MRREQEGGLRAFAMDGCAGEMDGVERAEGPLQRCCSTIQHDSIERNIVDAIENDFQLAALFGAILRLDFAP